MTLKSSAGDFLFRRMIKPFVIKPGLDVPADAAARRITVVENVGARHGVDRFIQERGKAAVGLTSGQPLDMMPTVAGGFQPGDIVLRGNSVITTAQSGWFTSLTESWRTGHWAIRKSAVSHVGVVVRDHDGQLRVAQMVSGDTPAALAPRLTPWQRKIKATFLRLDSLPDFFNSKNAPFTRSTVMRPNDPALATSGAERALQLIDTQITTTKTHPWYAKLPHGLAPGGRGGVCSTFIDQCFNYRFRQPHHIPTTPQHFIISPNVKQVGERAITEISAVGPKLVVNGTPKQQRALAFATK